MNQNSEEPIIDLETGFASFNINMTGDVHHHSYLGKFTVKCVLSPIETIEADKTYRTLLGEYLIMASDVAKDHAFALAQLKYRITEFPPFWQTDRIHGNLEDSNVIIAILNLSIEAQEMYLKAKSKERQDIEERLTKNIRNKIITEEAEIEERPESIDVADDEKDELMGD